MFVNLLTFPPIKPGKEKDFLEWFAWSNKEYAEHEGFINRRLLKPKEGGNFAAIVEHESYETFMAMHKSETQAAAFERVEPLFDGKPSPQFYEVVRLENSSD